MVKTFYYFVKKQKYELLTCFFAIASLIAINCFKWSYLWSIMIVFISTLTIIYLRIRDKLFYFISLRRRKQKDEWIGSGDFNYTRNEDCFKISNSDSGYIYTKCLTWNAYTFSFKFKIIKHCIGIIVRAVNLSNYAMFQIDMRTNGIRPHLRINGGWKWWEANECGLNFTQTPSLDNWYQCHISCENKSINVKLTSEDGKEEIFNRSWDIPMGSILFHLSSEDGSSKFSIPYSIILDYGTVGFRNNADEAALVKEVLVKKN